MPYISPPEADPTSWLMTMRRRVRSNLRPILFGKLLSES